MLPRVLRSNYLEEVVMLKEILRCAAAMVTTQSCCAELIPEYPHTASFDLNKLAGEVKPLTMVSEKRLGRAAGSFGRPGRWIGAADAVLPAHPHAG